MKIPNDKYHDQSQHEGIQAAALRDKKKIGELKSRYDLKNPEVAFEVYEYLVANPYYFESDLGKQFLRDLLKTAIHSDTYLMDETSVSLRMTNQEFQEVNQAVSKQANDAVKGKVKTHKKHYVRDKHKSEKTGRRKSKKNINKGVMGVLIGVLIICILIFGKSIYEIIDYEIKSYQSAKKIEELISCILEPVDPYVSEESRLDDLIASGLDPSKDSIDSEYEDLVVLHQYSELYERNHDLAGWISIEDTIINYPVMLTKDDEEYYIKRDFDKNSDLCGLPFMDADCEIEKPKTNFLIYGHNMKNGSMFSSLLKYENYEYYEKHSSIRFDTIYEEGIYDIISVFQTQVAYQDEDIFRYYTLVDEENEIEYNTYVQNVLDLSMYSTGVTATYGNQLLVLSTCDRRVENGRFVVVARKRK